MHVQIYFYLYIEVNNCTTSKVSNISYVECKTKGWWNRPKHTPLFLWWICDYKSANMLPLKRLVKTYYLLLDFLKACQSVLIRKVKF